MPKSSLGINLFYADFYRTMLCIRGTSHGPLSMSVSVTSRSSTKTAKHRITKTKPHDISGTLVVRRQRLRNSTGFHPLRGRQMQGRWVKIGDFGQIAGYISKTVQDRHMLFLKVE